MESKIKIKNKPSLLSLLNNIYNQIDSSIKDSLTLTIVKQENQSFGCINIHNVFTLQYNINFESSLEKGFILEVNLKDFIKAIRLQKSKFIDISFNEFELYFTIPYGNIILKRQFNSINLGKIDSSILNTIKIDKKDIQDAVNFCVSFKSTDLIEDGKDELCFNYTFCFSKKDFLIYTTNRHIMGRYKVSMEKDIEGEEISFLISPLVINILLNHFSEESEVSFQFTRKKVLIRQGNLSILLDLISPNFNFSQLLPQKFRLTLNIDTTLIQSLNALYDYEDLLKWGEVSKVKYIQESSKLCISRTHSYDVLEEKWTYKQEASFPIENKLEDSFECEYMEIYLSIIFNKMYLDLPCNLIIGLEKEYLILFQKFKKGTKTALLMPIQKNKN